MTPCPGCDGNGVLAATTADDPLWFWAHRVKCWRCNGEGWIDEDDEGDTGPGDSLVPVPDPPTGGQARAEPETEPTELETDP